MVAGVSSWEGLRVKMSKKKGSSLTGKRGKLRNRPFAGGNLFVKEGKGWEEKGEAFTQKAPQKIDRGQLYVSQMASLLRWKRSDRGAGRLRKTLLQVAGRTIAGGNSLSPVEQKSKGGPSRRNKSEYFLLQRKGLKSCEDETGTQVGEG